jgi:NSS family neurotransmitter:Na+ symporter
LETSQQDRGAWGSTIGFVLAAAGSAIGLGNIWRFPYITGQNGGAAFVVIYLAFVFLIGVPVMIAELTIGRHTQKNPVGAFLKIVPGTPWHWVGMLGVLTGVGILSFYGVVAGWTLGYFFKALAGDFAHATSAEKLGELFTGFIGNPAVAIGLLAAFMGLTMLVVVRGIAQGIERWSKILMPVLFVLLIMLAVRSVTLPGARAGLEFYLQPDFSKIHAETFAQALGQALFSLSLGMGAMITYGSYLSRRDDIPKAAASVAIFDTLIAVLAGLMIFPALFAAGLDPAGGPGLVFVVLPSIFANMPGGWFFGSSFFLLLSVAALTSTISLLEVPVSYLVDEKGWSRRKAVAITGTFTFVLGIPSALSQGGLGIFSKLPAVGMGFLDFMNALFGNYSLSIGAFLISVFVGYKWGVSAAITEVQAEGNRFPLSTSWGSLLRFICPIAIFVVLAYIAMTGRYF